METSKWVCPLCGGDNIQAKAWVSLNGNDINIDFINDPAGDDRYCDDCGEYIIPELIEE